MKLTLMENNNRSQNCPVFVLAHIEHHVVNNWNKQGILRTTKDSIRNWTYANYKQPNNQKTLKEAYASYNRLNSKQIYAFLSVCLKMD